MEVRYVWDNSVPRYKTEREAEIDRAWELWERLTMPSENESEEMSSFREILSSLLELLLKLEEERTAK